MHTGALWIWIAMAPELKGCTTVLRSPGVTPVLTCVCVYVCVCVCVCVFVCVCVCVCVCV
jgi:hypothetical protein